MHLAACTTNAVAARTNVRQTDFGDVDSLAEHGQLSAPDGAPFGPSGVIVNCPIVSSE